MSLSTVDVRISALSKSVQFSNVRFSDVRLKSGRFRPVIGRPVLFNLSLRLSDVRFQFHSTGRLIAETGSKPVWNRFWSIRTIGTGSKPDLVRNPDNIVRISDV